MRFAIIGCGVIGPTHARSIAAVAPDAELVLCVDLVAEKAAALATQYGAEHTTSLADALARDDIDAVAVCTPSGTHADLAIAALEAGKHVVIEKPLDVSVAAANRVAEAARRSGRVVTVISQHRFDPASQVVREAVDKGQFGRLTSGLAGIPWWRSQSYYDSGDWRGTWALDGGGALMNQGIHTIDLLVWLLGEPAEVYAQTACLAHERIEVEDVAVATIRFASGRLGVVHGTTAAYPGLGVRVQVHGDRGSAVIEGDELAYFHAAPEGEEVSAYGIKGDGNQAASILAVDGSSINAAGDPAALSLGGHARQYRDFLDAVATGREPLVTIAEATKSLAVICGIYESARTGKPVDISALMARTS